MKTTLEPPAAAPAAPAPVPARPFQRWLPWLIVALFAGWALSKARVPRDAEGAFALRDFGVLPVTANGRIQPLDSLGRNTLLQLREKQSANLEPWKGWTEKPKILSASEWLATTILNPELADTWPVFRIDNPDVKGLLALPVEANAASQTDGKHFSYNQIRPKLTDLEREARRASLLDSSQRGPYERALINARTATSLYLRIQNSVQPRPVDYVALLKAFPPPDAQPRMVEWMNNLDLKNPVAWGPEFQELLRRIDAGVIAFKADQEGKAHDEQAVEVLGKELERLNIAAQIDAPLVVPPHSTAGHSHPEWSRASAMLLEVPRGEPVHYSLHAYAKMAGALREGRVADFNDAVADYRATLGTQFQPELKKTAREQLLNHFQPFYLALTIFVIAGLCAIGFWFNPERLHWLRRTAFWLVVLALTIHTAGLIFRMVIEGRPPVTNLYSSAVFIGWGAVVLGLVLEAFWRNAIGLVVACVVGFLTLIIAHHLSLSGDTMEMMRAVLDTNFWLATHVVVVTLGYASTFVAGVLAAIYVIRGVLTPSLGATTGKSLAKMVYGIICFATLFSFVGTVLGGIWADQSWGRFWGWDPKENGALIIVLWNALILHARWGGIVKDRGLMNLAIAGNIVTAWSWFGVNMLGIGLHSYGFMDAAFWWLMTFNASQLVLIALGSLPLSLWRSFRSERPAAA